MPSLNQYANPANVGQNPGPTAGVGETMWAVNPASGFGGGLVNQVAGQVGQVAGNMPQAQQQPEQVLTYMQSLEAQLADIKAYIAQMFGGQ